MLMVTKEQLIRDLAERLRVAEATRTPCCPIREALAVLDLDTAYAIQRTNVNARLAAGERLVGRKIGLTSKSVQAQMGIDQPDFGVLFENMVVDGGQIDPSRVVQPKVEAEIAFILGKDLTQERATLADVIAATAYVVPALEVVDSRIAGWDINIQDTIADNASAGVVVLGNTPKSLIGLDLELCGMALRRGGVEIVSTGVGAACMDSPLNATAWLARKMADVGLPLKAGDVVMTGALGPMVSARRGDNFEAQIAGIGTVRASFLPQPQAEAIV